MTIGHTGLIVEGKFVLDSRDSFIARVHSLEGKRVELIVREYKAKRSEAQNRLYWGTYIPAIAEYCGYTHDEAHEALRQMFLKVETGKFPTVRSTSSLSTAEFTDYLDRIGQLAAENQIAIGDR